MSGSDGGDDKNVPRVEGADRGLKGLREEEERVGVAADRDALSPRHSDNANEEFYGNDADVEDGPEEEGTDTEDDTSVAKQRRRRRR
jgi:hypothetical protein